ncbi:type III restriction enzyme, res subunit [Magnetococcus marinus MC-1]|uniref:Type III restriction enzyme, res subunit n=1 Tax=Magnetococcus marinus (strain ATCC BAA-1437 / JCM 17883 / MC-1) TaxID=156889 RepID=A0LB06_MAGMM|nr:DEAD/DEAH box helicase [Magnetococcus marinus]ABK45149.1 type III restriction enzyme, res subunit [Magnetococcus marinus MC-1]
MILRPRQEIFVSRSVDALYEHGDTLAVGPTGMGKSICLSAVVGRVISKSGGKACVLAHRDELTQQNVMKFTKVNPGLSTSVVDARGKSWRGRATFAMVPTLARQKNLDAMPDLDLLVIDEAHHAVANSYTRIIDSARGINPNCMIYGLTATSGRGDKKALRPIFSNVADQVRLGELIQSGHLVKPRTFVVDVGTQDALKSVRKTADDFDMAEVSQIMNKAPVTEAVIKHWKEKAGTRKTIVFCSTVDHAQNVTDAFNNADVEAVMVHGELSTAERKAALARFEKGSAMVVVNVAVLTEGYDHPPTSCVVLLRPSSYKSTMIQMVGRGLRTVDPALFPGLVKTDCIVLDFGTSSILHGSLEQDVNLDGKEILGAAPTKECRKRSIEPRVPTNHTLPDTP